MNKVDIKSLMIGILGTILFFVLNGAVEDDNLGDIVVNSITIQYDGHGGFITAFNQYQK